MIISLIRLKTINEFTRGVNPTSTPPPFHPPPSPLPFLSLPTTAPPEQSNTNTPPHPQKTSCKYASGPASSSTSA
jgi:hypothetical protein